jgi:hypothetical protein
MARPRVWRRETWDLGTSFADLNRLRLPPTLFGTLHPQNRVASVRSCYGVIGAPFATLEWWNSVPCTLASRPLALARSA